MVTLIQHAIKKQKAQRGVSKPDPVCKARINGQHPQGGGVPSDTLHVEPIYKIISQSSDAVNEQAGASDAPSDMNQKSSSQASKTFPSVDEIYCRKTILSIQERAAFSLSKG